MSLGRERCILRRRLQRRHLHRTSYSSKFDSSFKRVVGSCVQVLTPVERCKASEALVEKPFEIPNRNQHSPRSLAAPLLVRSSPRGPLPAFPRCRFVLRHYCLGKRRKRRKRRKKKRQKRRRGERKKRKKRKRKKTKKWRPPLLSKAE
jgi:hypothetical protein